MVAAAGRNDEVGLKEILGPDSYDLIHSGEPVLDRDQLAEFASKAREMKKISYDRRNKNRANLIIGIDDWPFAIPIVKSGGKWFFDTQPVGRRYSIVASDKTNLPLSRSVADMSRRKMITPCRNTTERW